MFMTKEETKVQSSSVNHPRDNLRISRLRIRTAGSVENSTLIQCLDLHFPRNGMKVRMDLRESASHCFYFPVSCVKWEVTGHLKVVTNGP